eukprot:gnl/TRDRNA2_/TRDRNA2_38856_c0_seq1.p1 gnl/TRDRNA2_/TRDRNA2_38856_c0~~gnl/TRDRNA2_/TRDRNA2_38856_c0_seq1.p1  ORF type:complete len:338 (-),score=41.78 gnl/TRDRNA2_/TRDRNA2_38856_c0_seq1:33-1046(-)
MKLRALPIGCLLLGVGFLLLLASAPNSRTWSRQQLMLQASPHLHLRALGKLRHRPQPLWQPLKTWQKLPGETYLSQLSAAATTEDSARGISAFQQKREAVMQCLAREYRSFFRPFEEEFYSEDVSFKDPLNDFEGKDNYKSNVQMLSGESFIGNILFSDGFIDLHGVEEVPGEPTRLRTRWTLGFVFKLLPWKPKALFTGISEYTIAPDSALVLSQRDYWDTLSLQDGGSYVPEDGLAGVAELVQQLLPDSLQQPQTKEPAVALDAKWQLLRRAEVYRIYRNDDGLVFALGVSGFEPGLDGVERELKRHGLQPGQRIKVKDVEAIQVEQPHPWQCDS